MSTLTSGYYSSSEKDIIRSDFDRPLLDAFCQRKGSALRYFGLPGPDALDVRAWRDIIVYVAAVEQNRAHVEKFERLLDTQFPEIRYAAHWGDLDQVILKNKGKTRMVGGEQYRPWVGTSYRREIQGYAWDFDILNLDYFGAFLPEEPKGQISAARPRGRQRAAALRRLFELDRQDAWQAWVLFITVEAQLVDDLDRDILRAYLRAVSDDSPADAARALDSLLSAVPDSFEETARLVHGATAVLVSLAASELKVSPRGTIIYRGAHDQPMIHLVYEFEPAGVVLSAPVPRHELLRSPILRPRNPLVAPWFELTAEQVWGLTVDDVRRCLDFLSPGVLEEILADGQRSLAS